jgi:hypothetical protein
VVLAPDAGAKFCGVDPRSDGGKRARLTGESTKETVKPLRREGRMFSAEPVCSCACSCAHIARETAGAARTRLSLRPPPSREGDMTQDLGASRRESANACLLSSLMGRTDAASEVARRVRSSQTHGPAVPRRPRDPPIICDVRLCRGPTFSIDCQRACVNNAISADIWHFAKMFFHRAYTRMIS